MKKRESRRGGLVRTVSSAGRCEPGCMMEAFETRTLMDAVFWDGGAGTNNWHDAANWNRNGADAVPLNGDDVTINVAANPTVTFSTGTLTLNSLTTNEALTLTGGTLGVTGTADINAVMTMQGGNASGGTWDVTGGTLRGTSSGGSLINMNILGDVLLDSTSAGVRVSGSTRFGTVRLLANAVTLQAAPGYTLHDTIVAEGATTGNRSITGAVGGSGTLTIAPTGVIRLAAGSGGSLSISNSSVLTLVNDGLITAEAAGRNLTINNSNLTNNATISAAAGGLSVSPTNLTNNGTISGASGTTLTVDGAWTNAGTISSTDGTLTLGGTYPVTGTVTAVNSAVTLGGAFNSAGLAGFSRTGGTVAFTGTMTNTGNTFTFNAATGSWNQQGGNVVGGTVVFSGQRLVATSGGGSYTDVQINGDLVLDTTSANVRVSGSTRFGAARLAANAVTLQAAPGYVLHDLVVAEGATTGGRSVTGAVGGTGTLTISPTGVIRLAAGSGGNLTISNSSVLTLVNNGLISAEAAGRTLTINNSTFTNNATIQVSDGTLNVSPTNWTNAGTATATGGALTLDGTWTNTGTITSTNATVNLGGSFTTAAIGSFSRTGGTVNLMGTMTNTGNTFTFNAATGSWNQLGGSVTGGTVVFSGERLVPTSSGGTYTDVQINGDLVLETTSATVRVSGSTRFAAARLAANAATLQATPGYVLHDLVVAEGAAVGGRTFSGAVGASGTLTIAPTGVIRLAVGSGGNLSVSNSSVLTLINNGLISAEAAGRTLTINNSNFTNDAAIQVSDGTLNVSPTNWTNAGTATATGGVLTLDGNWSNPGTITSTNATVNLAGAFTALGVGTFNRTGGTVNLTGTMTNTGNTFTFNATTGSWNQLGGNVTGGTVVFTAERLVPTSSGGAYTDVQINGDLVLDTTSAHVRVSGSTRFNAARLAANAVTLQATPGYVLHDLVVAEGATLGGRSVTGAVGGTGTLTISPTGVIRLADGSGGNLSISNSSVLTLINNGLISAEAAGRTLTINNSNFTNDGAIQVSAGTLNVSPTSWTNAGTAAATGGVLTLDGNWSNPGTITSTNATVNLAGSFTALGVGTFSRSGGTVNLTGTMANTGNTFTLNAATGSWNQLGGNVTGGTVVFSGERLVPTSSGGMYTDVQINGELVLDSTSAHVRVSGSTRFTAVRLAANAVTLQATPGYVLHDLVVVEGATLGGRSVTGAVGGTGTLTISPTGVIRLAAGSGGNLSINNSSVMTLINEGLIINEAAGRTLSINNSTFTNNGTVQASAGTLNISPTTFTNYAKGVLTGGAYNAFGPGVITMPAGTQVVTNNATVGVGNANNFPAVATLATNNGTLQTGGGGTYTITPDGGTLVNNGTVRLGPTSTLRVAGDFSMAPSATMVVEIQGFSASDIGRMIVTGTATIDGHLDVVGVNGFVPECVNSVFLTADIQAGEFATQSLPTPPDDHQALVIYIGGEIRFAISPPSDYNQDGVLNSQDFFDFLTDFFDNNADYNEDGVTNSQDYFDFVTDFFEGCN